MAGASASLLTARQPAPARPPLRQARSTARRSFGLARRDGDADERAEEELGAFGNSRLVQRG
jgi:hypothetical protein